MMEKYEDNYDYAKQMDKKDPLGHFRKRFYLRKDEIYMCGHSLGAASEDAERSLLEVIGKWKEEKVKIWSTDDDKYCLYAVYLAKLMAPIVGADADEVAITGGTTVNIHQTISTFYKPSKERYKILVDDLNFPTDRYAVDSQVRLRGYDPENAVKVVKSTGAIINENDIIEAMTDDVFLVFLPAVYYSTAQVLDMEKITQIAKERCIIIGWDLSHAVGALEINLKELDADFAVWCTYKYLNGGPGSTAGLYINRKHFQKLPGLIGWFGNKNETQFLLRQEFDHQQDASGWQISSPSLFSMATLAGSLRMVSEAGVDNIRKKSLDITGYLMYLIEKKLLRFGFRIGNVRDDASRGGHVSLEHQYGSRICAALNRRGVISDFRNPNTIRLAPTALCTSYEDVYHAVNIIVDIMETELKELWRE